MKLQNKILAVAISSVLSQSAFSQQASCDSQVGAVGWSVWCAEAPLDATAAGPGGGTVGAGSGQSVGIDIGDATGFGGETEGATPTESNQVFFRASYRATDVEFGSGSQLTVNVFFGNANEGNNSAYANMGGDNQANGIGTTEFDVTGLDEANLGEHNDFGFGLEAGGYGGIVTKHFDTAGNELLNDGFTAGHQGYPNDQVNVFDTHLGDGDDGLFNTFDGLRFLEVYADTGPNSERVGAEGTSDSHYVDAFGITNDLPSDTLQEYWVGTHDISRSCPAGAACNSDEFIQHRFVGGTMTALADIAARNSETMANYYGASDFHNQTVNIDVNFNTGTFDGNFRGGNAFQGVGELDFDITGGTITGARLSATTAQFDVLVNPGDTFSNAQASLSGAFIGPGAQGIVGAYSVAGTINQADLVTPGTPDIQVDFNDTFVAIESLPQ